MGGTEKPKITYRQLYDAVGMSTQGHVSVAMGEAVKKLKDLGLITADLVAGKFYGDEAKYHVVLTDLATALLCRIAR